MLNKLTPLIAIAALSTGCASVTNGFHQDVDFSQALEKTGAEQCTVVCEETELGKVDLQNPVLEVRRSTKDLEVKCGTESIFYESSVNTAGKIGIILIDGGLVDFATGALWEYEIVEEENEQVTFN